MLSGVYLKDKLLGLLVWYLNERIHIFLRLLDLGVHNINSIIGILVSSLISTKFLSVEIGSIVKANPNMLKQTYVPAHKQLPCDVEQKVSRVR